VTVNAETAYGQAPALEGGARKCQRRSSIGDSIGTKRHYRHVVAEKAGSVGMAGIGQNVAYDVLDG